MHRYAVSAVFFQLNFDLSLAYNYVSWKSVNIDTLLLTFWTWSTCLGLHVLMVRNDSGRRACNRCSWCGMSHDVARQVRRDSCHVESVSQSSYCDKLLGRQKTAVYIWNRLENNMLLLTSLRMSDTALRRRHTRAHRVSNHEFMRLNLKCWRCRLHYLCRA